MAKVNKASLLLRNKYKFIGLDTNIFVYYFNQHPEFGKAAKNIIDNLAADQIQAVTNEISVIELLSHPILSKQDVKEMEMQFSEIPNLKVLGIGHILALEAARIRREYGFRLADSIQLATAVSEKAKAFITNDADLKKFKELKVVLLEQL